MNHLDNVIDIRRPVEFSIDGRAYQSRARRQRAADLLRLAGLDPQRYRLCQLRPNRPTRRYTNTDLVEIHRGTRFLSIRSIRAGVV
jgi:hypothetical protein